MNLENIQQYQNRRENEWRLARERAKRSGIACPHCGKEMANMDGRAERNAVVWKVVRCLSCGETTEVYA